MELVRVPVFVAAQPGVKVAPERHAALRMQRSGDTKDTSAWLAVGGLLGATVACQRSRGLNGSRGASLRFALAAPTSTKPTEVVDVKDQNAAVEPCACPLCNRPFSKITGGGAVCKPCGVGFPRNSNTFLDLTISSAKLPEEIPDVEVEAAPEPADEPGLLQRLPFVEVTDAIAERLGLPQSKEVEALGRELIKEPQRVLASPLQPPGTSTFQSPLVSFAYERGWRRSFASSGFPGPDEEFRLAQDFLKEGAGLLGDTLLDASCGSGLFSRRFVSSKDYSTVVALDFSESMLKQVDDFAKKDFGTDYANPKMPGQTALKLVRGDIARLPFESNSLGGVHAGAAIHCWPNPENAVAEIARVLRPGGVFVLSTFMPRGPLRAMGKNSNPYRFWTEEELQSLTRRCGLVDFKAITKDPAFIMVRVKKPMFDA